MRAPRLRLAPANPPRYLTPPIPPVFEVETWLKYETHGRVENKASQFVKVTADTSKEAKEKVKAMFDDGPSGYEWRRIYFVKSVGEVRPS